MSRFKLLGRPVMGAFRPINEGCRWDVRPVIPPETKSETNPSAKSIGEANLIRAPQSVPSQLKVLIAEGTPIVNVRTEKTIDVRGFIPLMNMW